MNQHARLFGRLLFGAAVLGAAGAGVAPARNDLAPIVFQEMSTLSGGDLEFPALPSDTEKCTVGLVDTNGDGWDDLIVLAGQDVATLYMLNVPDGNGGRTFVPAPEGNGLTTGPAYERDGAALTAGDVDLDGDLDLFIGVGYNDLLRNGRNLLMLNDGTGKFTDVAATLDVDDNNSTTCAAAFFDYDLDGDLDLYTCNTTFASAGKSGDGRDHLYRNLLKETGSLAFTDVINSSGIAENGQSVWAVSTLDYDGDGWPDLLVSHDINGPTQLFRNLGDGTFTEVTNTVGAGDGDDGNPSTFGNDTPSAMGVDGGDFDNDGDLDFYFSDTVANNLYRNNGDGTLTEIGTRAGVRAGLVTWGVNWADFDLDGWLDLYVAAGDIYFQNREEIRSWLYRNNRDGTFTETFETSAMRNDPPLNREDGSATGDYDHDGRIDLLSSRAYRPSTDPDMNGASPYLYRNVTDTGECRWISVTLRGNGTTSNTSAVGARIRIWPRDESGAVIRDLVQLREVASQVGRCSVSSFRQIIGLGPDAASVDVQVTWPRIGDLRGRSDLYLRLPIPEDGHLEFTDDLPAHLFPASPSSVTVSAGVPFSVPAPGTTGVGSLPVASIEDAPEWVSLVPADGGGWLLEGTTPPAGEAEDSYSVGLLLENPQSPGMAARIRVELDVIHPPFVSAITVKGKGKKLALVGGNFPINLMTATVDGIPCKKIKVNKRKNLEPDGDGTEARVKVPLKGQAARGGPHILVLTDTNNGAESLPYEYMAPE